MNKKIVRIATRQSPLALWQANHVKALLMQRWPQTQFALLPMVTSGDTFLMDRLQAVGGKGLFVKELEHALLQKKASLAVHSTKDMPALCPDGLVLGAICKRDNPLDALVSNDYATLAALPDGALVGTASLRRQTQLLAFKPQLFVQALRGNITTRLAKLDAGEFQAIVLAAAGLERLGLQGRISQVLPEDIMLPSCAQGALCIECREDDEETHALIACLHDELSALCVNTERAVNAQLGGNCHVPLAVYCKPLPNQTLVLKARLSNPDGSLRIEASHQGGFDEAVALAALCAQSLWDQGAAKLLQAAPS